MGYFGRILGIVVLLTSIAAPSLADYRLCLDPRGSAYYKGNEIHVNTNKENIKRFQCKPNGCGEGLDEIGEPKGWDSLTECYSALLQTIKDECTDSPCVGD